LPGAIGTSIRRSAALGSSWIAIVPARAPVSVPQLVHVPATWIEEAVGDDEDEAGTWTGVPAGGCGRREPVVDDVDVGLPVGLELAFQWSDVWARASRWMSSNRDFARMVVVTSELEGEAAGASVGPAHAGPVPLGPTGRRPAGLPAGPVGPGRELGIDPGAELRRVHAAILAQDPGLDLPAPAKADQGGRVLYGRCPTSASDPRQPFADALTGVGTSPADLPAPGAGRPCGRSRHPAAPVAGRLPGRARSSGPHP
jgi:hypothetical protein